MAYTTNPSLLAALKSGNNINWLDFQKTYKPLIMLRAKDFNLTKDEAEELMHSVLLDVFHQCESFQYDPAKGRFRDYMRKLIGNNCVDIIRKRKDNADEIHSQAKLENIADESEDQRWLEEWHNHLFEQATAVLKTKVEPNTFLAYEMYAVKGLPASEVAKCLDMTQANVYLAKSRCLERLSEIIRELEDC